MAKIVMSDPDSFDYSGLGQEREFEAPEVILTAEEVMSSIGHIEQILRCMRTLVTIGDYFTMALYELSVALKHYAAAVEARGSSEPNHNVATEGHVIRSRCISEAVMFWENIAQVNDGARLKLLKEFSSFNQNANQFFELHAAMHSPTKYIPAGPTEKAVSRRKCPWKLGQQIHQGSKEIPRCPFMAMTRVSNPSSHTPKSAVYRHSSLPGPAHDGPTDEAKLQIDQNFRALEDGFLKSFVIEGTMAGSHRLRSAVDILKKMAFDGLKEGADLLDIDLSGQLNGEPSSPLGGTKHRERHNLDWSIFGSAGTKKAHKSKGRGRVSDTARLLESCPFLSGLDIDALNGVHVNPELLLELIHRIDCLKQTKGCSSKAPYPATMKNMIDDLDGASAPQKKQLTSPVSSSKTPQQEKADTEKSSPKDDSAKHPKKEVQGEARNDEGPSHPFQRLPGTRLARTGKFIQKDGVFLFTPAGKRNHKNTQASADKEGSDEEDDIPSTTKMLWESPLDSPSTFSSAPLFEQAGDKLDPHTIPGQQVGNKLNFYTISGKEPNAGHFNREKLIAKEVNNPFNISGNAGPFTPVKASQTFQFGPLTPVKDSDKQESEIDRLLQLYFQPPMCDEGKHIVQENGSPN
ncbi:hypothetical protein FN846DRAFT_1002485 [Sphaerosporella brunnea]|uniref:Uncharacterized protein n=1 Tax=Sphaerosporella brunnea TaxID=1250544 RepID=A0A5J5F3T0_9PEZI|nr:hypothetical protein FN846DRAFT_1002485 [Sphaerosporella brunnea]